ncbi:hypothetical protein [Francisella sp. SYW-9]|uniref:hypothetical protein n=1 Tax=Francisella sp. SYW-9 TaxID=2610888 RepID=UPI00123DCC90|nr:hypothetical protein [Francisella sp. SYW-9]
MLSFKEYFINLKNKQTTIVTDCEYSFIYFSNQGYRVVDYKLFNGEKSSEVLFIATTFEAFKYFLNKEINSYVLVLSLLKFDKSIECLKYSFNKLLNTNIDASLIERGKYFSLIDSSKEFSLKYNNSILNIDIKGELYLTSKDISLKKGIKYTVPELFEASFVSFGDFKANYNLNGVFPFQNITYVCRNDQVREIFEPSLLELKSKLKSSKQNNYLHIKDNVVIDIKVNNMSYSLFSNYPLSKWGNVVEVAMGVNKYLGNINWDVNSPMNEGVDGFHLGIGYGIDSPHIDFILHDKQYSLDFL